MRMAKWRDGHLRAVYACDDTYAMQAGVSMISLLKNNEVIKEITLYVLCCRVSEENVKKLSAVAEHFHRKIVMIDVEKALKAHGMMFVDAQQWSIAAYARLLTPKLLPDVNRILYLDCDTLVLSSLEGLWATDIGETSCAMVSEPFSALHKKNVGMTREERYYNSGVMLIDLAKWREANIIEKFSKFIHERSGRVPYVDQGCINGVCKNDIYELPARYNVYTLLYDFSYEEIQIYRADRMPYGLEEIEDAKLSPVILHFTSSFVTSRPWIEDSTHPCIRLWEEYLAISPWAGTPKGKNRPDIKRRMLKSIYQYLPSRAGLRVATLVNSYVRPMMKR